MTDSEALYFLEQNELMGKGVDIHLLVAVAQQSEALLWTRDKRLAALAQQLNLGFI